MDQVLIAELYQNIIEESKQVGVLYHTTNVKNARNILKTNTLLAKSSVENDSHLRAYRKGKSMPPSISFTRNKRGWFYRFENVKFLIDGNKLSHRYKVIPYSHWGVRGHSDENEERVFRDILNVDQYIIKVELPYNDEELISLLGSKDIPYIIDPELKMADSMAMFYRE